jgi:hypothetical protein
VQTSDELLKDFAAAAAVIAVALVVGFALNMLGWV